VEFKSNVAAPRVSLDSRVPFRGLTLVNSHKPKAAERNTRPADPPFSAAEMRHNFAIWALEKDAASTRRLHLYYCVRCKWAFSVDDRRGLVTPVDPNGKAINGVEAAQRLATFSSGPCSVFNGLIERHRFTQEFTPIDTFRARLVEFFSFFGEVCKARFRQWRHFLSPRKRQIHGSARR
jgi:hypothetical protein